MAYNKIEANGQTLIDLTNDTATESDVLAGQTFHLRSGAPGTGTLNAVTEIQPGDNLGQIKATQLVGNDYNVDLPGFGTAYGLDIYDNTLPIQFTHPGGAIADGIVYGNNRAGENELEITAETQTASDVRFTVDKTAGTITANGMASGFARIIAGRWSGDGNSYTISGCPANGSDSTYAIQIYDDTASSWTEVKDFGNGAELESLKGHLYSVRIWAKTGTVCDNLVFKPMLQSIGVGERTKNFIDLSVVSTETRTGVTFTVDRSTGTVTVDGTNTDDSDINYRIEGFTPPLPGNYYFSGCPEGGTLETYYIIPYDVDASALLRKWNGTSATGNDYGTGPHEILIKNTTVLRFTIRIKAGYTADNLVFKPMLWLGSLGEDSPFIPYGYQIPLDLRQRSYNELDIRDYAATYYGVRWYEQDGILYANGTYNDNAAHSWPRLYLQLGSGTYVVSGSTDYQSTGIRVQIGTCDDAQGTNFASLGYDTGSGFTFTLTSASWISVRMYTKADLYQQSIGLEFPLMVRKADAPSEFKPYMWYYDHDEGYIGETPLTAGQSRPFYDMGIYLIAQPGTSYIDTTLYNKPRVEMVPYDGIFNVINRLRKAEVGPEILWEGGAGQEYLLTIPFKKYLDEYDRIDLIFTAWSGPNATEVHSTATVSIYARNIAEAWAEHVAGLISGYKPNSAVYKNFDVSLQWNSYDKELSVYFQYDADEYFDSSAISLEQLIGIPK